MYCLDKKVFYFSNNTSRFGNKTVLKISPLSYLNKPRLIFKVLGCLFFSTTNIKVLFYIWKRLTLNCFKILALFLFYSLLRSVEIVTNIYKDSLLLLDHCSVLIVGFSKNWIQWLWIKFEIEWRIIM